MFKTYKGNRTRTYKSRKLKRKKTYYVKVRAYKTYQSKKYFGNIQKRKKSKFQRSDDIRKKTDEVILLICLFSIYELFFFVRFFGWSFCFLWFFFNYGWIIIISICDVDRNIIPVVFWWFRENLIIIKRVIIKRFVIEIIVKIIIGYFFDLCNDRFDLITSNI